MHPQLLFRLSPNTLNAAFILPDGTSRRGWQFMAEFKHGEKEFSVPIRSVSADDLAPHLRKNLDYHYDFVLNHVAESLKSGWDPSKETDSPLVYVKNPPIQ